MDFDQIQTDQTFGFGVKEYKGVTVTRSLITSGGFLTTKSHKKLYTNIHDGLEYTKIAYSNFKKTDGEPRASLVLCHGITEHSQRYNAFCYKFAQDGYDVHTIDFRSFGRSGGARGSIKSIGEFHEDLLSCCKRTNPDLPLFLFGHSLGGGTQISFLLRNQSICPKLAGIILSGPFTKFDNIRLQLSDIDMQFMRSFKTKLGMIYLTPGIGISGLMRRPEGLNAIFEDTKMFPLLTVYFSISIYNLSEMIQSFMREKKVKFDTNIMLLSGGKDLVCNIDDQKEFLSSIKNDHKLKKHEVFPDALHEPMHDYEAHQYIDKWSEFMDTCQKTYKKADDPIEWGYCKIGLKILTDYKARLRRFVITIAVVFTLIWLFKKQMKKAFFKLFIKFMQWYYS